MLHIWGAREAFICDEHFSIVHNGGIAFEENVDKILAVGEYDTLCSQFPNAKMQFFPQGVLLPALINAHIHFEFGAHFAQFCYGDFGTWLDSLMDSRDEVLHIQNTYFESILTQGINEQINAGVGSVGAVSSYGYDMSALALSPLRVVYFNEAIGSNPSAIDFLYANMLERLNNAKNLSSPTFTPAIALHSPYSLHPIMAQKLIDIAAKDKLPLSTHFLESAHEREWLTQNSGYFKTFFQRFFHIENPQSFYSPQSFLDMLSPLRDTPLSLTHCLHIKEEEAKSIESLQASIITCPRSNRLLNNAFFSRSHLHNKQIPLALGTDGKSSNNNVNLLDELRVSLYAYPQEDILALAKSLLLSATLYGAKALGLNNGTLSEGKNVDFAIFEFSQPLFYPNQSRPNQSPLQFILHAKTPSHLYINAKAVL
ncbi:metal-dependent hydrolase [Helicobacter sp. MIT 21-1697]|uniref:aminofutalosine deaminase family hydrolase n=1 Tax=Helicobacter sp. MIT 21-1697 TaxID=2993733 RepID=UPI00224AED3F|nr:metal-dependent hydrolase [Helicobacter sp. MIT 21-1697]MCX2716687.1 metal-dependent hydrolase [Helicobacter sp. MIT 21-1697]